MIAIDIAGGGGLLLLGRDESGFFLSFLWHHPEGGGEFGDGWDALLQGSEGINLGSLLGFLTIPVSMVGVSHLSLTRDEV